MQVCRGHKSHKLALSDKQIIIGVMRIFQQFEQSIQTI